MNEGLSLCDSNACESPKSVDSYHDSLVSNLERKVKRATEELQTAQAALAALKANPEVANILELIKKASR